MTAPTLAVWLAEYDRLVEVGIGTRTAVAATLAREGKHVTATDIRPVETPPAVRFLIDDITTPRESIYAGADVLYARRLPGELHRPFVRVAHRVGATAYFTTLGDEGPALETTPHTLAQTTVHEPVGPLPSTGTSGHEPR